MLPLFTGFEVLGECFLCIFRPWWVWPKLTLGSGSSLLLFCRSSSPMLSVFSFLIFLGFFHETKKISFCIEIALE